MQPFPQRVSPLLLIALACASCGSGSESHAGGEPSAETLLREGRFEEVVEFFEADPEIAQDPERALFFARALVATGKVPKAERVCVETLAADPTAHEISVHLAEIYLDLGLLDKSIAALTSAREAGASDADIALFLGVCAGRAGDLDTARVELERAAAAGVERAEVDYNLGVLLFAEGSAEEAESAFRRVLAATPDHRNAQRELARVLVAGPPHPEERLVEGDELLNAVLDADPEDWRAYELLGDVSMCRADPEAAVLYYTEALRCGRNPIRVEEKYRVAERARRELLRSQGILVEDPEEKRGSPPPLPENLKERFRQARKERAEAQQAAGDGDGAGDGR